MSKFDGSDSGQLLFCYYYYFLNMFIDSDHTQDLRPTKCTQKKWQGYEIFLQIKSEQSVKSDVSVKSKWNMPSRPNT